MEQERWLGELTTFLRIPSISTLPAHDADCRRAAEWVAADLRRLGCRDVQLLGSDTHPVVWCVGPDVPGAPTVLLYGHYDVQPPDPINEWTSPPFEPSLRNGRLYARGAADDKGQVFCLLRAIEALGAPPVNFRFLIEGEEEFGSKVLFDLLRREPERTRADVALVADMSYVAPGWPAVYTSLRGMCYAEIAVRTAKHDLHSGEYGGAAPNAHEELCRLLVRLKSPNGRINIPGLYAAVQAPSARERAAWKRLPFREKDFLNRRVQAKALTGLKIDELNTRVFVEILACQGSCVHGPCTSKKRPYLLDELEVYNRAKLPTGRIERNDDRFHFTRPQCGRVHMRSSTVAEPRDHNS